jgi:hypothetical protein
VCDCTVRTDADVADRTTRGRAVRHMAGNHVDSWHMTWLVCSEWDDDTWPNQWPPRVTWIVV